MKRNRIYTLLAAVLIVGGVSGCSPAAPESPSSSEAQPQEAAFSGESAYAYAEQYSEFGIHRTGTDSEIASTKWIAEELGSAGFETELQELSFTRFDLTECTTIVDGTEIDSFPFLFPVSTGEGSVEAPLTFYNEEDPASMTGKIVYYDMPGMQTNGNIVPIAEKASEAGALAVIATVIHPNGLPSAQNTVEGNAETSTQIPAVIVSVSQKEALTAAAQAGATASVKISGTVIENAPAYNVVGRLDNGADRWVVVTTPVSGWFTCNAERGGGVGVFLELANVAAGLDYPVNYLFLGNTGHELSFMGAHASEELVPPPGEVDVWIHLGSSIAAKEAIVEGYKFLGFSEDLSEQVQACFENVPDLVVQNDQEKLMQSELGNIISNGYSCFGLYGANKDFHTSADVSDGISLEQMNAIGGSIADYLQAHFTG